MNGLDRELLKRLMKEAREACITLRNCSYEDRYDDARANRQANKLDSAIDAFELKSKLLLEEVL